MACCSFSVELRYSAPLTIIMSSLARRAAAQASVGAAGLARALARTGGVPVRDETGGIVVNRQLLSARSYWGLLGVTHLLPPRSCRVRMICAQVRHSSDDHHGPVTYDPPFYRLPPPSKPVRMDAAPNNNAVCAGGMSS